MRPSWRGIEQANRTVAVPAQQRFAFVQRLLVQPAELEHDGRPGGGARGRRVRGNAPRLERTPHPDRPACLGLGEQARQIPDPRRERVATGIGHVERLEKVPGQLEPAHALIMPASKLGAG